MAGGLILSRSLRKGGIRSPQVLLRASVVKISSLRISAVKIPSDPRQSAVEMFLNPQQPLRIPSQNYGPFIFPYSHRLQTLQADAPLRGEESLFLRFRAE